MSLPEGSMRRFTLKTFSAVNQSNPSELEQIDELTFCAMTAQEGKQWLTSRIDQERLRFDSFHRFSGSGDFPEVRPAFVFNISFYLFPDNRICPVRIWQKSEQFGDQVAGPDWKVDFNGIPGWSSVASIEPRWHPIQATSTTDPWAGRSDRNWWQRDCWRLSIPTSVQPPESSHPIEIEAFAG